MAKLNRKELQLNDLMPFGKHRGKKVKWVLEKDPAYLNWWDDEISLYPLCEEVIAKVSATETPYDILDWPDWM